MPTRRRTITFSLPPEMEERLQQAIKEDGRTMSDFIREATRLYLDEREWLKQERRKRARTRLNKQEQRGGDTGE